MFRKSSAKKFNPLSKVASLFSSESSIFSIPESKTPDWIDSLSTSALDSHIENAISDLPPPAFSHAKASLLNLSVEAKRNFIRNFHKNPIALESEKVSKSAALLSNSILRILASPKISFAAVLKNIQQLKIGLTFDNSELSALLEIKFQNIHKFTTVLNSKINGFDVLMLVFDLALESTRDHVSLTIIENIVDIVGLFVRHSEMVSFLEKQTVLFDLLTKILAGFVSPSISCINSLSPLYSIFQKSCTLLSTACLLSDQCLNSIRNCLSKISTSFLSIYHYLLCLIINPCDPSPHIVFGGVDPTSSLDTEVIWSMRLSIIALLLSLVSAPEDTETRIILQNQLQRLSLDNVFALLLAWNAPPEILEQMEIFNLDIEDDSESALQFYTSENAYLCNNINVNKFNARIGKAAVTEYTVYLWYMIHENLNTMNEIFNSNLLTFNDYVLPSLNILESLTHEVVDFLNKYSGGEFESNWKQIIVNFLSRFEKCFGVGIAMSVPSKDSQTEIMALKKQLIDAQVTIDEQRREIAELKANMSVPANTAENSLRDEIRRLKTLVSDSMERSPLITNVKTNTSTTPSTLQSEITDNSHLILHAEKPMQYVDWDKIPVKSYKMSLWGEIFESAYIGESRSCHKIIDDEEKQVISYLYSKNIPCSGEVLKIGSKRISIIEKTRAYNIEILLASIRYNSRRLSYKEINEALMFINDDILDIENLLILIELVYSYQGDVTVLGNAERFVLALSNIPRLHQRTIQLLYSKTFHQEYASCISDLDILIASTETLLTDASFKKLLEYILVIGNYLNGTTFRGFAHGIQISSLPVILNTTPSVTTDEYLRGPTLLHYVVGRVREKEPDFNFNFGALKESASMDPETILESCEVFENGFLEMKNEVEVMRRLYPLDEFCKRCGVFVSTHEPQMQAMAIKVSSLKRNLDKICVYFSCGRKVNFFKILYDFWMHKALRENSENDLKIASKPSESQLNAKTPLEAAILLNKEKLRGVDGVKFVDRGLTVRNGRIFAHEEPAPNDYFKTILAAKKTVRKPLLRKQ